ncbi:MAG: hypothetical protein EXX96DRAFT_220096 [Benjaminiella poitrasii]|nr:MAG: hypothetical protein EXX96DRAFT_220096 [Benjaminiella poitrasii]
MKPIQTNSIVSDRTIGTTRSFCPLILYHDNPSEQLSMKLNANQHQYRTAIDRHRDKTNEMLERNAQFWFELSTGLVEYEADDIKVSPSTSTTSNISSSSSSSSSGDSIATVDQHHRAVRPPIIESHQQLPSIIGSSPFYSSHCSVILEENKTPSEYPLLSSSPPQRQSRSKSTRSIIQPIASNHPHDTTATKKRRRGNLPKDVTEFLRKWLIQHKKHPYPAEKEKADLARHTGLTVNQISNWFINARRRILQPMLESENLTAQIMAYPELMSSSNNSHHRLEKGSIDSSRRRRYDFYTYEKYFSEPSLNEPIQSPYSPPQHAYSPEHKMAFHRTSSLMETNHVYHPEISMLH